MKKEWLFTAIIIWVMLCSVSWGATYGGGSGTAADPYQIWTAEQMNTIGANSGDWSKCFKLMADIDMSPYTGTQYNIIGNSTTKFTGTFDGNGFVIRNLTYSTTSVVNYVGLFGYTSNATIKNLGVENVNFSISGVYAGALIGYQENSTVTACHSTGSIVSSYSAASGNDYDSFIGGLIGSFYSGTLSCSYSLCHVDSSCSFSACSSSSCIFTSRAGGLVGYQNSGSITTSYSAGLVISSSYSAVSCAVTTACAGGLTGEQGGGTISYCYSMSSVASNTSLTTSNVSGSHTIPEYAGSHAGGLVGWQAGTINKCYSTGTVTATGEGEKHTGGLAGISSGDVLNCFWDTQTSGLNASAGGNGRTTVQLKQADNYFGWNTSTQSYWILNEGIDYPRLNWESQPGTPLGAQTFSDIIPGAGTTENPYRISTPQQLSIIGLFNDQWDKVFSLQNSIDMTGWAYRVMGTKNLPFKGTFYGNGYVISNLTYMDCGSKGAVGLIGYASGATITNLGVTDVNISTQGEYAGSLVGYQENGTISNCYSTGSVALSASTAFYYSYHYAGGLAGGLKCTSSYLVMADCNSSCSMTSEAKAGGLVGNLINASITNCFSAGSVTASILAGGLLASESNSTITDCYSTATVVAPTAVYYQAAYAGGLLGWQGGGTVSNCYAAGTVSVSNISTRGTDAKVYAGGLLGYQYDGTLIDCYSTGAVCALNTAPYALTGGDVYAGGLAGWQNKGVISSCYSTSSVTSSSTPSSTYPSYSYAYAGGLLGYQYAGSVVNCYSKGPVEASSPWSTYTGGLIGWQCGVSDTTDTGMVAKCYSTGTVVANGPGAVLMGGLIGLANGVVINCYWDTQTSGLTLSGGGKGRTTDQMKQMTNYIGWNAPTQADWTINDGIDYPRLNWETQPGEPLAAQIFSDFIPGAGTAADPYRISTPLQLSLIGLFEGEWSKIFHVQNSIDMAGWEHNKIGNLLTPFRGTFDGKDFVISNLTYTAGQEKHVGLFGYASNAAIKNIGMENVNVSSQYDFIGGLIGEVKSGTITNCYVTGTIQGAINVGGLTGKTNSGVTISSCHSTVSVCGKDAVGGLTGYAAGTITFCHSNSVVNAERYAGGLVGILAATITDCCSTGSTTTTASFTSAGGLAGYISACTMTNCHSAQSVTSAERGGGLAGEFDTGTIANCYSEGSVKVSADSTSESSVYAGGLIGRTNSNCTITNCYSSAFVDASSYVFTHAGGLVGRQLRSAISGSFSTGAVTAVSMNAYSSANANAGGLVGDQYGGTITNCYSMSDVTASSPSSNSIPYVGGLVGMQEIYESGKIDKSYSMGKVEATGIIVNIGGFLGGKSGTITSCFWDIETSGLATSAGGTGVQGKTTAEMLMLSTFVSAGWDFSDSDGNPAVWKMTGSSYPLLSWENTNSSNEVPYVIGMTEAQAETTINAAGFISIFNYSFSDTVTAGSVISQNPAGGTTVLLKTAVIIEISRGERYFESGSGSPEDPYCIAAPEQMFAIGINPADWQKSFKLTADLDMSGYTGTQYNIIGNETTWFSGVFDGDGHTIRNLHYNSSSPVATVGLFGCTYNAVIKNLKLENIALSVEGQYAGGLVGLQNGGTISCCSTAGTIQVSGDGGIYAGGLAGYVLSSGTISQCSSDVSITSSSSYSYAGGLIGYLDLGTISNCRSTGAVTASTSSSNYIGGLLGRRKDYSCTIEKCFATGKITATGLTVYQGGLLGYSDYPLMSRCFWDTQTSGMTTSAGGSFVTGKTTAQMKILSTFASAGWDFNPWVGGKTNNALMFSGNDYVEIPAYQGVGGSSARTVSLWIKTSVTSQSPTLVQWGSDSTGQLWMLNLYTDGTVMAQVSGGSVRSTRKMNDDQWHHIAVVLPAGQTDASQIRLYIDGLPETIASSVSCIMNTSQTVSVHLGAWYKSSTGNLSNYFVGLMDDVRIYERDLTAEEISPVYAAGLTAHWKLDETSGTSAQDSAGSNSGVLYNMVASCWVAGRMNNALSFDGVNDYVEMPGYKGIAGTESRTCTAWIKTTAAQQGGILCWGAEQNGQKWMFRMESNGTFGVGVWGGYINTTATINNGQWHHVAAVLDSDGSPSVNEIQLYIDGVLQNATPSNSQVIDTIASMDVMVGANKNAGVAGMYFNGLIDDACIYNRALSANEIILQSVSMPYDGLTAHWAMDEIDGNIVHDSASSYDGTYSGTSMEWTICEGTNYPRLIWQIPAGDFACPDGVSAEDLDYFIDEWLIDNCTSSNNYCGGADMDGSGKVDLGDWAIFAANWLEGVLL